MYGKVYKITNKINGKSYIGVTTKSLQERFDAHLYRANAEKSAVQKAMKKYGKENFTIELIDTADSKDELFEKETSWIAHFNTFNGHGYNLTLGGGGIVEMSEDIKNKISKSKTGKKIEKLQGREITHDWRVKISRTLGCKVLKMFNPITGDEIFLDYLNQCRDHGFHPGNVSMVLNGKRKHTKGYFVEYVNPDRTSESNNSEVVQRIPDETTNVEYNSGTRSRQHLINVEKVC
jgi:group I intron endonuclease